MATYYMSGTGLDTNPGTKAAPWLTFTHTDSVLVAGDVVVAEPGNLHTLTSAATLLASGTKSKPINWISGNLAPWRSPGASNNPIIRGGSNGTEFVQLIIKGNYVNFIGFEANDPSASVVFDLWGQHCHVDNCYIHDIGSTVVNGTPGAGIFDRGDQGAGYNEFAYNEIVRISNINLTNVNGSVAHCIYTSGTHNFIHHNLCMAAPGYGIYCHATFADNNHVTIVNNLCAENGNSGIAYGCQTVGDTTDFLYCANNILLNNGKLGTPSGFGIRETDGNAQTGFNSVYDHNLTYGNSSGTYHLQNNLVPTNPIFSQPTFINYQPDGTGDYHALLATSAQVDAGVNTLPTFLPAEYGWVHDLDGVAVPKSTVLDVGPYVFVPRFGITMGPGQPHQASCGGLAPFYGHIGEPGGHELEVGVWRYRTVPLGHWAPVTAFRFHNGAWVQI